MYLAAWVIAVGIISFQEIKVCHEMPWPPRIIGAGVVFVMLDLFSPMSPELAAVMAIGFVLALLICTIAPNNGACLKFTTTNCTHTQCTPQPNSYAVLGGAVAGSITPPEPGAEGTPPEELNPAPPEELSPGPIEIGPGVIG